MNGTEVFICANCGTKLQEIDGQQKCYICGEERASLTLFQIRTHIERAKKWIYYGEYDEAKKELFVLEQHQISGSIIYMLKLMMDMQVATQEELRELPKDFHENANFQQALKCSAEHPEDYTGALMAEYAQMAVQNKKEKDEKDEKTFKIISYAGAVILTFSIDSAVAPYQGTGLYSKFWIVWIATLIIFFGRKKIPTEYKKTVYTVLGIVWAYFYAYWCYIINKYG